VNSYFNYRDIGLTSEEAQALLTQVTPLVEKATDLVGKYAMTSERAVTSLSNLKRQGEITATEFLELKAAIQLMNASALSFAPLNKPDMKDKSGEFFTAHPSFGCASHSILSSTHPSFVGSPSMSSSIVALRFYEATLTTGPHSRDEARLSEGRAIVEVELAEEQFSGLMRSLSAGSPCALGRYDLLLLDMPPRMIATVSIAASVKEKALAIGKPLTDACADLREHLSSDRKISSKAEYAELKAKVDNIKTIMGDITEPLNELLAETAGLMAAASTKQMLAEIFEPLKALGMNPEDVLRLTFQ
jgi:hypothetical protein